MCALAVIAMALLLNPLSLTVSPGGSDLNPGTSDRPLLTLGRALEIAGSERQGLLQAVAIHLEPGVYPVAQTVEVGPEDSNMTITGEPGACLSGGVYLNRWKPVADRQVLARIGAIGRSLIRVSTLAPAIDLGTLERQGFGIAERPAPLQLFFDDQPMTVARYPTTGWLQVGSLTGPNRFMLSDGTPFAWGRQDDLWALGFWNFDWAESYEKVIGLDSTTGVEIGATPPFGLKEGRRFFFLNLLEGLSAPGDWVLDRASRMLYFWPPAPLQKHEAVASVLPGPMFHLKGCHDVQFSGLKMEFGRDGGVLAENSENVAVLGCEIANFGTYGVALEGCQASGVAHCRLHDLGATAISLDGGDRKTLAPANLYAEDNDIYKYARRLLTYHPGVEISGVGNRVCHNAIHDAPHQAILLSGNDHLVEYNDIRRVCTGTGDAGAVYMGRNATMRGNMICFNRFREIGPHVTVGGNYDGVMSVYLDDCFDGATIFGNVFEGPGTAIMLGGGRDNIIENNTFLKPSPGIAFDARGRGWAAENMKPGAGWNYIESFRAVDPHNPPYSVRYPALAATSESDLANPGGNVVEGNLCLGGTWITYQDSLTQSDLTYSGNVVLVGGNFAEASMVAPQGIKLDQIGPRP